MMDRDREDSECVHIIVVPPRRGPTMNFRFPAWVYDLGLSGLVAVAVMIIGGVVLTAWMGLEIRRLRAAEGENKALRTENLRIAELEHELKDLDDLRRQVLDLAGMKSRTGTELVAPGTGGRQARVSAAFQAPPAAQDRKPSLPKRWPIEGGVVSKDFQVGVLPAKEHHGIDIAASHGAPVHAAGSGSVSFAGQDSVFGQLVIIDHGNGLESLYGHNSALQVGAGDWVQEGQQIARVGSTGESSGPHLHFEVRRGRIPVDPRDYLGRGTR